MVRGRSGRVRVLVRSVVARVDGLGRVRERTCGRRVVVGVSVRVRRVAMRIAHLTRLCDTVPSATSPQDRQVQSREQETDRVASSIRNFSTLPPVAFPDRAVRTGESFTRKAGRPAPQRESERTRPSATSLEPCLLTPPRYDHVPDSSSSSPKHTGLEQRSVHDPRDPLGSGNRWH